MSEESWKASRNYLTFIIIPGKWWSWRAWKLAWTVREMTVEAVMRTLNTPLGDTVKFQMLGSVWRQADVEVKKLLFDPQQPRISAEAARARFSFAVALQNRFRTLADAE